MASASTTSSVNDRTLDIAYELSKVLRTDLDRDTLRVVLELLKRGVPPTALALAVKEARLAAETVLEQARPLPSDETNAHNKRVENKSLSCYNNPFFSSS
eukprot:TRINITY_DN4844_c0_g1_i3.p1 TRINITY_DN4844_c0_g1~~TRINITY_DN4844_c0_g1_i3.p1  ORF type:complete len:112 (-),score=16.76 TRINITY_DN4844_c0_g1_i3:320-619(-)